jgi:hypothetical protein
MASYFFRDRKAQKPTWLLNQYFVVFHKAGTDGKEALGRRFKISLFYAFVFSQYFPVNELLTNQPKDCPNGPVT